MFGIIYILIGFVITMRLYGPSYKPPEDVSDLGMIGVRILSTLIWPALAISYLVMWLIIIAKFIKNLRGRHEKDISNSSDGNSDDSVE